MFDELKEECGVFGEVFTDIKGALILWIFGINF